MIKIKQVIEENSNPVVRLEFPDGTYTDIKKYHKFNKTGEIMRLIGKAPLFNPSMDFNDDSYMNPIPKAVPSKYKSFNHWYNATCGEILGCSPSRFKKHLNGLIYKTFVAHLDQFHVKKFAFHHYKLHTLDPIAIEKINTFRLKLDQLKKDGIYNVAPFTYSMGADPQQLKKYFGKSLWKKLTKNSFTKNNLIVNVRKAYMSNHESKIAFEYLNEIPSSILRALNNSTRMIYGFAFATGQEHLALQYVKFHLKGKYKDVQSILNVIQLFIDTVKMAEKLDETVKMSWNLDKLKRIHDEFSIRVNRLKYSSEAFDWLNNEEIPKHVTCGEYTAELLTNELDIATEGEAMHHCVGGYASWSSQGNYAVYSVKKNGERYSTIGFAMQGVKVKTMYFNQHYLKYNDPVECIIAKKIPDIILGMHRTVMNSTKKSIPSRVEMDLVVMDEMLNV